MPSSLFPQNNQQNNLLNSVRQFKGIVQGGPPALFSRMVQSNPQFRSFAESMRGKTPEQAFSEYGLDFNEVKNLLG